MSIFKNAIFFYVVVDIHPKYFVRNGCVLYKIYVFLPSFESLKVSIHLGQVVANVLPNPRGGGAFI